MTEQIGKVADFVREYLMETGNEELESAWGLRYRWEHTLRVAHWAWQLACDEEANVRKCIVAALFHDVSHFVSQDYRTHGARSAEIARDYLSKQGYAEDFIEDVAYSVKSHVGEFSPKTIEAKILQDADTLDRFGYFRILLLGKSTDLSSLEKLAEKIESSKEYLSKVEKGDYGPMWTKKGKAKLKELVAVNKMVLEGILGELENTKNPETYLKS